MTCKSQHEPRNRRLNKLVDTISTLLIERLSVEDAKQHELVAALLLIAAGLAMKIVENDENVHVSTNATDGSQIAFHVARPEEVDAPGRVVN